MVIKYWSLFTDLHLQFFVDKRYSKMTTGISHNTYHVIDVHCLYPYVWLLLRNKWISISTFDKKQHDTIDWRQTFCYRLVYVEKVCLSYTTQESLRLLIDYSFSYNTVKPKLLCISKRIIPMQFSLWWDSTRQDSRVKFHSWINIVPILELMVHTNILINRLVSYPFQI